MANTIRIQMDQWPALKARIEADHGDRIFLISWRLRRDLGFTLRLHRDCEKTRFPGEDTYTFTYSEDYMCLDFYDDAMETMFRLRYL